MYILILQIVRAKAVYLMKVSQTEIFWDKISSTVPLPSRSSERREILSVPWSRHSQSPSKRMHLGVSYTKVGKTSIHSNKHPQYCGLVPTAVVW